MLEDEASMINQMLNSQKIQRENHEEELSPDTVNKDRSLRVLIAEAKEEVSLRQKMNKPVLDWS